MVHHLRKFLRNVGGVFAYIFQGFCKGQGLSRLVYVLKRCAFGLDTLTFDLENTFWDVKSPRLGKWKKQATGLHATLPRREYFTYTVILAITEEPYQLSLDSILNLSAPDLEILVVTNREVPKSPLYQVLVCQEDNPFALFNRASQKAKGRFLLLMTEKGWLRPDLLYRYEQTLQIISAKEKTVLYCDEFFLTAKGQKIPGKEWHKSKTLPFPYVFSPTLGQGFLVARALWSQVGGFSLSVKGGEELDLLYRLHLEGAEFLHIPLFLVGAFTSYSTTLKVSPHVRPKRTHAPTIHVIIPFKDQKALTLSAVKSVLAQEGVEVKVTAVDNGSYDSSISEEIKKLHAEVLPFSGPFNYSKINNYAVEKGGIECEYLLFLNNDVVLDPGALEEMSRWASAPKIGLVGCQLHYPNGQLQHGGTELCEDSPYRIMDWRNVEKHVTKERLLVANRARIVDSVTAACALIKRERFLEVGGFDEVGYPIAYSDTNLAVKLKKRGYFCFYTPFASGVHEESVSRKQNPFEDYEQSRWLHELYEQNHSH